MTPVRLADIVAALGGALVGDADITIDRLGSLEGATSNTLAFLSNPRYRSQLATTRAAAVIVAAARSAFVALPCFLLKLL